METKEQLVTNIKEWIKMDTEIAELKAQIKDRTAKKKTLTENLVTVMKTNKIDCFDINGGALVYKQVKPRSQLMVRVCWPRFKIIIKPTQRPPKI